MKNTINVIMAEYECFLLPKRTKRKTKGQVLEYGPLEVQIRLPRRVVYRNMIGSKRNILVNGYRQSLRSYCDLFVITKYV